LRFFKVPEHAHGDFWPALLVASILHDLGKANSDFQQAVRHSRYKQPVRHEHLTALLLGSEPLLGWLARVGIVAAKFVDYGVLPVGVAGILPV
jgi:CRISPR-associated endonuclease/helicase Cas3